MIFSNKNNKSDFTWVAQWIFALVVQESTLGFLGVDLIFFFYIYVLRMEDTNLKSYCSHLLESLFQLLGDEEGDFLSLK